VALVTLEVAKLHCRVTDTRQDADLQRFLDQGEAGILDYLQDHPDVATWTTETLPPPVQQAILLHTDYFYRRNRGDDPPEDQRDVWAEIRHVVARFRTPAFA
jgi:hypothetical protein